MTEKPMIKNSGYIDVKSAVKLKETESKAEERKLDAENTARMQELVFQESAKETASKHLAKFAGIYLTFLVVTFIFSIKFIPAESIAVVAGLITLVVSNLSTILKGIVESDKNDEADKDKLLKK
tara:strand:- start:8999 stop:9370 length:372 start_codon:yes stop_codon:yes gene_type:complete